MVWGWTYGGLPLLEAPPPLPSLSHSLTSDETIEVPSDLVIQLSHVSLRTVFRFTLFKDKFVYLNFLLVKRNKAPYSRLKKHI